MNFTEITSYIGVMLIGYGFGKLIEFIINKNKENAVEDKSKKTK